MPYRARREIERARARVFFILPWRHDFLLAALGHPRGADLRQQMDIALIRQDHHLLPAKCSACQRIRAKRSTRCGSLSLATNVARFHTHPNSWSQRRTVHADTPKPCLVWSASAKAAQLQRVRHHPYARGEVLSKAVSERLLQGIKTVVRTGAAHWPSPSTLQPNCLAC